MFVIVTPVEQPEFVVNALANNLQILKVDADQVQGRD